MNEKKYSYLPNSYTIKFFKESEEKQQKSFKPLIIINNIKNKKEKIRNNNKKLKKPENYYKNKNRFTEKPLSQKKKLKLIEKRKKAIEIYLNTKKNTIIIPNKEKKKYVINNKMSENSSLSSFSKNISHIQKNHSFQNSKKKSNIISQIKNEDDNKVKKMLHYCGTEKEFNIKAKTDKNVIDDNNINTKVNNIKNENSKKNITIHSIIIKSNSQKEKNTKEERCRTSDKTTKTNKIYLKDISMKDNCFIIDNLHKEKNIKSSKISPTYKNENKNDTENKEIKSFKPNMNIFKNTKFNNFKLNSKNDIKRKEKNKIINLNGNKNNITENISNNKEKLDNYDNKKNISYRVKGKENENKDEINHIKNNINYKNSTTNNRPLNITDINKNPINSQLSQFTFKNEIGFKEDNQNTSILTEKRRKELKKLINFTNKF